MVFGKSGMSHDTARILNFWQTLAASGRKSTPQRYNLGYQRSAGMVVAAHDRLDNLYEGLHSAIVLQRNLKIYFIS
jgi:hypothetical protein